MTVEEIRTELGKITAELTSSGFDKFDSNFTNRLDELTAMAGKMNMKEGKRLIENLVDAMKSVKEGESKTKSCNTRLTALDFYLKKLSSGKNIAEQ